ncbi:Serine/threonine exchanger SteT [Luteitalea pratensis]|uniref:Serine/threonine exchanger SteT n=1 Tax=Luteitalea pratensis TaxID=1855912 RepID=A0A143PKY1_LUTPR|nr:amino acid permease [Luteitalea pratensis]AMY08890.1 Serine/threonine exchanger SteT [Luteitalea pratensis]
MATARSSRPLQLPSAVALVVGQVIAVGIFLTPGTIIRTIASPLGVLLVWAVMGTMAICGALCYGALAARFPHAGGGYVYLREAYGPRVAFLYGWKCLLVMDPGITAALATGFASYATYIVPLGNVAMRAVAIGAIAAFAAVHIAGVRVGVRLLTTIAVLKIVLVVILTLGAIVSPAAAWSHFVPFVSRHPHAPPLLGAVAGAFVAAFFSFGGWWEVTKIAGEVRDPSRTLPRALWAGLAIVTLAYTAATLSFIAVVPIGQVAEGQAFIAQVGEAIVGPGGGTAVAAIVIVCVLGSLGAMQMIAPRLYVAMAQDGVFPAAAAALHPRFGTPARAIATQAVLASVLVAIGTFDTIVAFFVFITVVFIAATVASVLVLRRRESDFQVPMHPWSAVVFLALVVVLLLLIGASNPMQALLGVVVVAAAVPVYRMIHARRLTPLLES